MSMVLIIHNHIKYCENEHSWQINVTQSVINVDAMVTEITADFLWLWKTALTLIYSLPENTFSESQSKVSCIWKDKSTHIGLAATPVEVCLDIFFHYSYGADVYWSSFYTHSLVMDIVIHSPFTVSLKNKRNNCKLPQ